MPFERFLLVGAFVAVPGVIWMFINDLLARWDVWLVAALWTFGFGLVGMMVDLNEQDEHSSAKIRAVKAACILVMGTAFFLPIVADSIGWKP